MARFGPRSSSSPSSVTRCSTPTGSPRPGSAAFHWQNAGTVVSVAPYAPMTCRPACRCSALAVAGSSTAAPFTATRIPASAVLARAPSSPPASHAAASRDQVRGTPSRVSGRRCSRSCSTRPGADSATVVPYRHIRRWPMIRWATCETGRYDRARCGSAGQHAVQASVPRASAAPPRTTARGVPVAPEVNTTAAALWQAPARSRASARHRAGVPAGAGAPAVTRCTAVPARAAAPPRLPWPSPDASRRAAGLTARHAAPSPSGVMSGRTAGTPPASSTPRSQALNSGPGPERTSTTRPATPRHARSSPAIASALPSMSSNVQVVVSRLTAAARFPGWSRNRRRTPGVTSPPPRARRGGRRRQAGGRGRRPGRDGRWRARHASSPPGRCSNGWPPTRRRRTGSGTRPRQPRPSGSRPGAAPPAARPAPRRPGRYGPRKPTPAERELAFYSLLAVRRVVITLQVCTTLRMLLRAETTDPQGISIDQICTRRQLSRNTIYPIASRLTSARWVSGRPEPPESRRDRAGQGKGGPPHMRYSLTTEGHTAAAHAFSSQVSPPAGRARLPGPAERAGEEVAGGGERAGVGLLVVGDARDRAGLGISVGEAVLGTAVHVQLPVRAGGVHLLGERGDVGERDVRVHGAVAHEQPRPHLAGLGVDAGGQAAVDADRGCDRCTGPGELERGQAAEAEPDDRHPLVDGLDPGKKIQAGACPAD